MRKINQQSTKIFCRLMAQLDSNNHVKLYSEGFMPLVLEMVAENIQTPFGRAKLYSLAHYYKQNGDMMRDPEMCFVVIDSRKEKNDFENIFIFPQMFRQDNLGIYEESILISENKITGCKKRWQDSHCHFTNTWLKNISQQGFL
jgi:hypothetical protein